MTCPSSSPVAAKNWLIAEIASARYIFSCLVTLLAVLWLLTSSASAGDPAFASIETETLDEKPFMFPDDLRAGKLNIVMLAISEEQDNGTWQGEALLDWYAELAKAGLLSSDVMAWHFSVLKVPFFVKGLVRGGMGQRRGGGVRPRRARDRGARPDRRALSDRHAWRVDVDRQPRSSGDRGRQRCRGDRDARRPLGRRRADRHRDAGNDRARGGRRGPATRLADTGGHPDHIRP